MGYNCLRIRKTFPPRQSLELLARTANAIWVWMALLERTPEHFEKFPFLLGREAFVF
jgi:hypothetical protein